MKSFEARSVRLSRWILLILVTLIPFIIIEPYALSADVQPGSIYVGIRKLTSRDAKNIGKTLNHPCELSDDVVAKILSSIYYKEKGLLKKERRLAVFTSAEVRNLTPLVAEAFSRAADADYVIIYSAADRTLLSDLHTYCMLFVTENELNVVFTTIRQKLSYNVTESEKARIEKIFGKPLDINKSAFWELVPVEGQRLKGGHLNWLLIDLKAVTIGKPIVKGEVKEQVLPETAYTSELEERIRKLEAQAHGQTSLSMPPRPDEDTYIRVDVAKDYVPKTSSELGVQSSEIDEFKNLDTKEKLQRLRALRDEGLITEDDYRSKKAHIVMQEQKNKSVREKLKELRDMKDEGLITEKDYESLKKELLDKLF
ncbi:MAG: SHOCT domain-containing protein [Planctomycetes bacterium]|nr:SHOCT domain-containing protein [Planctomycetota bacterium]